MSLYQDITNLPSGVTCEISMDEIDNNVHLTLPRMRIAKGNTTWNENGTLEEWADDVIEQLRYDFSDKLMARIWWEGIPEVFFVPQKIN